MNPVKSIVLLLSLCSIIDCYSQTSSRPISIQVLHEHNKVAPGNSSFVTVQFNIPKGLWMGASGDEARIPPKTKIATPDLAGFTFQDPIFPESLEDWVPTKLGKTKVYREVVNVIVPYTVEANAPEGEYDLAFELTYTPGYSAGRLATHNDEIYTTKVSVDKSVPEVTIISPSTGEVGDDFIIQSKNYDHISKPFKFIFKRFDEDGFAKTLHKIWLDKPGHGKSVRLSPFPFLNSTNFGGSSVGLGASFFNATREGTVTGSFSLSAYSNDLIGFGYGITSVSCPGAYHNYQFSAFFGGEGFRNVSFDYENLTLANSLIGFDIDLRSVNEPRERFIGIGPSTEVVDGTAYRRNWINGIVDLYVLPTQFVRVGVGVGYDNYDVGTSFEEITEIEGVPFLQESPLADGLIGLNGGTSVSLRGTIIYDHRDQEFASSKGFYSKLTVSRNNLSNVSEEESVSDFTALDVDVRQYFSGASQKLVVLLRGALSLKSESQIPFDLLSNVGGLNSIRAYDAGRFRGQHSAFGSAEVRFTLGTIPVLGYPMSIEIAPFVDIGQVFGDGAAFGDELNVDPGFSFRMINKPNVGLVFSYAVGTDGGYLSGGIGLPF